MTALQLLNYHWFVSFLFLVREEVSGGNAVHRSIYKSEPENADKTEAQ